MKKMIGFLMVIVILLTFTSCSLKKHDPYPFDDEDSLWIYDGDFKIYWFAYDSVGFWYCADELEILRFTFSYEQDISIRYLYRGKDGVSHVEEEYIKTNLYDGTYTATEDEFHLLGDRLPNGIFANDKDPTFYKYNINNLPKDTPQEVLDYIKNLPDGSEQLTEQNNTDLIEEEDFLDVAYSFEMVKQLHIAGCRRITSLNIISQNEETVKYPITNKANQTYWIDLLKTYTTFIVTDNEGQTFWVSTDNDMESYQIRQDSANGKVLIEKDFSA